MTSPSIQEPMMAKARLTLEEKLAQIEQAKLDKFPVQPWLALAASTNEDDLYIRPMLSWGHCQQVNGVWVAVAADLYTLHLEWLKAGEFPEEWIQFDTSKVDEPTGKYPDITL